MRHTLSLVFLSVFLFIHAYGMNRDSNNPNLYVGPEKFHPSENPNLVVSGYTQGFYVAPLSILPARNETTNDEGKGAAIEKWIDRHIAAARMTHLELHNTAITDLKLFTRMSTIQELSLGRNRLKTLEGIMAFTHIRKIAMPYNELEVIPKGLEALEHLECLDLRSNKIRDVTPLSKFSHSGALKTLHLDGNQIEDCSPFNPVFVYTLKLLTISNNPLSEESLAQVINRLEVHLSELNTVIYRLPAMRLGAVLYHVDGKKIKKNVTKSLMHLREIQLAKTHDAIESAQETLELEQEAYRDACKELKRLEELYIK
jgi:Leucine-rich repeat (LRR) protein